MILETERLILSLVEAADAPFILDLLTSRGFIDNIGDRGVRDLGGALGYVQRLRAGYGANGFGMWRCDLKAGGAPAGLCGFVKRDGLAHPDIGYAFLEPFWGQGYASEAAAACMDHGRGVLGLTTIVAITSPANLGSIRVLNKIGLRDAGVVRLPNSGEDCAYFVG